MNTHKRNIIILIVIAIAVIAIFVFTILNQRVKLNNGLVTGNTAGNINNNGLFCESGDKVFFSNAYDNGCLYSMNADETGFKKLSTSKVSFICADPNYLYYYMDSSGSGTGLGFVRGTRGIYRSTRTGGKTVCLKRCIPVNLQLSGNYLYYQNFDNKKGASLNKIKINKTEDQIVKDFSINPASCVDGTIYYNGTQADQYLYRLSTNGDSSALVWEGSVWNPVYENGYFYYMDIRNDYRLCRYSQSENKVEVLTADRIDFFNVYGDMIYYQKSSATDPALKRMAVDGSNNEIVAEGVFNNINITSRYVYFSAYDEPVPVYRTPVHGAVSVSQFTAAEAAAEAANK